MPQDGSQSAQPDWAKVIEMLVQSKLNEGLREAKYVEVDLSLRVLERVRKWATLIAFAVGIPAGIVFGFLGYFGYNTYDSLHKSLEDAHANIDRAKAAAVAELKQVREDATAELKQARAQAQAMREEIAGTRDFARQLTAGIGTIYVSVASFKLLHLTPAQEDELKARFQFLHADMAVKVFGLPGAQFEVDYSESLSDSGTLVKYDQGKNIFAISPRAAITQDISADHYFLQALAAVANDNLRKQFSLASTDSAQTPDANLTEITKHLFEFEQGLAVFLVAVGKQSPIVAIRPDALYRLDVERNVPLAQPSDANADDSNALDWARFFWDMRQQVFSAPSANANPLSVETGVIRDRDGEYEFMRLIVSFWKQLTDAKFVGSPASPKDVIAQMILQDSRSFEARFDAPLRAYCKKIQCDRSGI